MKLIYLWVENCQRIKEQGFLLNTGYDVKYDKEKNELSVSKKDSIDSMLYGDKISITAIVGDNGAGKSTLLDVIRIVLFDNNRREKEITGFLVWEDTGKLGLFPFMKDNKWSEIKGTVKINTVLPNDFSLIYYSDFLDEKYYHEEFDDGEDKTIYNEELEIYPPNRYYNQLNISTSYLLRNSGSNVLDYFHSDTKRQINYYGSLQEKAKKLPFPAPASLSVKIEFLDIDIFDRVLDASLQAYEYRGMSHHGEINTDAYVIGLLKKMERIHYKKSILNSDPLDATRILQWDIFTTYIYDLLATRKQWNEESKDEYSNIDEIIKKVLFVEVNELEEIIWKELERIFSEKSTNEENFENYLNFYHKVNEMLKSPKNGNFRVDFYVSDNMIQNLREDNPFLYDLQNILKDIDFIGNFPEEYMNKSGWNGNWDIETFMDLYNSYMEISHEIDFLKCSWGMSSGENSMFNLFARLHEAMQKREKEKVILIFDELDSSFHPQWQQRIIDLLTSFLRVSYPQKEFQVILTTHSPVLLSDIPRGNVIFMRKENTGEAEHSQTFAANIASLYYDSFFMEKGSIGEVARRSIVNLMESISELEEKDKQKEDLERNEYRIGIPQTDRGLDLFRYFLQKQYPYTAERILKNCMVKRGEAVKLLQLLIDNIGEDIWRYKASERFHRFLKDNNKADRDSRIRTHLNELEETEGKEFVKEFIKQWLKEEGQ